MKQSFMLSPPLQLPPSPATNDPSLPIGFFSCVNWCKTCMSWGRRILPLHSCCCCHNSGKNRHPSCRPSLSLTALQLTFPLSQVRPGCPGQHEGCCFSSDEEKIGWKPAWTWLVISEVTIVAMWEFSIRRIFPKKSSFFTKSDFPKENFDDRRKKEVRKIQTVDSLQAELEWLVLLN